MADGILIFTGFVGGYGGAIKASRTYNALLECGEDPILVTESSYVPKLNKFGLIPNLIIDKGSSVCDSHKKTKQILDDINYKTMVSFGPRTFGPRHAVENKKKVVIVDGGLPPVLGELNTDHEKEIYSQTNLYALTCHFPWKIEKDIVKKYSDISFEVLSQPLDAKTEEQFNNLIGDNSDLVRKTKERFSLGNKKSILVQIGYSLFNEMNLESNGGWLKLHEYLQANEFISNLLKSLQHSEEHPLVLLDKKVFSKYGDIISESKIDVVALGNLPNIESMALSKAVSLNVSRAMRSVTQFQLSAIGGYGVVSPCPTNYMYEDVSTKAAEKLGMIRSFPFDMNEIGSFLLDYIDSEHYHSTRERRLKSWEAMHSDYNLLERILEIHRK
jgi:hypothetical protein